MVLPIIGAAISAGAGLIGGMMNRKAQEETNAQQMALAQQNMAMQKQFAQEGIRWRVEDAKAAGVHPLYALGAQTSSYSPVSVGLGADTSMGSSLASAGQDISRAISATRTQPEREQAFSDTAQSLTLTKMGLENELLATQVAKERAQIGPPLPGGVVPLNKEWEKREPIAAYGSPIPSEPGTSPAKAWEDMYSDPGGYIAAAIHAHHALKQTHPGVAEFLRQEVLRMKHDFLDVPEKQGIWPWTYHRARFNDRFGKWK